MKFSKRFTRTVAGLSLALLGARAEALSADVAQIFDKGKRKLSPPPKNLRSSEANWDYRYSTGVARVAELDQKKKYKDLSVNSDGLNTQPVESIDEPRTDRDRGQVRERDREDAPARPRATTGSFNGERVFGVGLVGAGAYGVFGVEFDFGIKSEMSIGFGLGTGMSYSTWGLHTRYFFREGTFSPFLQGGYANWYLSRASPTGEKVRPGFLAGRFFEDKNGKVKDKQRVHLVYPGLGVLYQSTSGIASLVQLQYFINMKDFEGGLYGSVGMYYYF